MTDKENQNPDIWEEKLDEILVQLKKCQEDKSLKSCFPCENFFECELRKNYVTSAYESMSKGSTGGFEF